MCLIRDVEEKQADTGTLSFNLRMKRIQLASHVSQGMCTGEAGRLSVLPGGRLAAESRTFIGVPEKSGSVVKTPLCAVSPQSRKARDKKTLMTPKERPRETEEGGRNALTLILRFPVSRGTSEREDYEVATGVIEIGQVVFLSSCSKQKILFLHSFHGIKKGQSREGDCKQSGHRSGLL